MNSDENVWREIWNEMKKVRYEWMTVGMYVLFGCGFVGLYVLVQYLELPNWVSHVVIVLAFIVYLAIEIYLHLWFPSADED